MATSHGKGVRQTPVVTGKPSALTSGRPSPMFEACLADSRTLARAAWARNYCVRVHLVSDSVRYFLEVARTGSIAGASENLHIAASSISRHVTRLEQSAGTRLFDRHPRGMI